MLTLIGAKNGSILFTFLIHQKKKRRSRLNLPVATVVHGISSLYSRLLSFNKVQLHVFVCFRQHPVLLCFIPTSSQSEQVVLQSEI